MKDCINVFGKFVDNLIAKFSVGLSLPFFKIHENLLKFSNF